MKYRVLNTRLFLYSFLQFYKFHPINFYFLGASLLKPKNENTILKFYSADAILMGLNTQMPPKISVALPFYDHINTIYQ